MRALPDWYCYVSSEREQRLAHRYGLAMMQVPPEDKSEMLDALAIMAPWLDRFPVITAGWLEEMAERTEVSKDNALIGQAEAFRIAAIHLRNEARRHSFAEGIDAEG